MILRRRHNTGDNRGHCRVDPPLGSLVRGRLLEKGDRCKVIHDNRPHCLGQTGTVERFLGLGRVEVLLDSGERIRTVIGHLWFEKRRPD